MAHMPGAAAVPAHLDRNKDPADFVALNKSLRACFVCRLVKSYAQVRSNGCCVSGSMLVQVGLVAWMRAQSKQAWHRKGPA